MVSVSRMAGLSRVVVIDGLVRLTDMLSHRGSIFGQMTVWPHVISRCF